MRTFKIIHMKKFIVIISFCFVANVLLAQNATIKKVTAKEVKEMIDNSTGPTIINFWASWCGPCIREIPYFESKVAQSATPVKLLLVSLDFPGSYPKLLSAFIQKRGYKSEVVYLNDLKAEEYTPVINKEWSGAIPASIFVDNSKKYYRFFNTQLTEQKMDLELKNLLN